MNIEILTFGDIGLGKWIFHYVKYLTDINIVNVDKILISNKISFGKKDFKYFIGQKDDNKDKSLCKMLPKMIE